MGCLEVGFQFMLFVVGLNLGIVILQSIFEKH